ncbi:DUF6282 family protein [Microbacterium sp. NPDC055910]|uniref:DUF6282 family protein n=1 Tax=Microbacterium sp. NPDC055910 TaxID=3345659 RepID=UPI0035DCB275
MSSARRELRGHHVLIEGAIDMHVHYGPEPMLDIISGSRHSVDPIQAAGEAREHGMGAIVLKPHEFPSVLAAQLAADAVPGIEIFGGITLDHPVGGINPFAVEVALRAGARVVWLPTVSALTSRRTEQLFGTSERFAVADQGGVLLPDVAAIVDLVIEYDAVLATGHITADEHFAVANAMAGRGKVVATHAMHGNGAGPELTKSQCVELAQRGMFIEFAAHTCAGNPAKATQVAEALAVLPHTQVVLSSDFGWTQHLPHPAAGLQSYVSQLWELGVPEAVLRQVAAATPRELLALE